MDGFEDRANHTRNPTTTASSSGMSLTSVSTVNSSCNVQQAFAHQALFALDDTIATSAYQNGSYISERQFSSLDVPSQFIRRRDFFSKHSDVKLKQLMGLDGVMPTLGPGQLSLHSQEQLTSSVSLSHEGEKTGKPSAGSRQTNKVVNGHRSMASSSNSTYSLDSTSLSELGQHDTISKPFTKESIESVTGPKVNQDSINCQSFTYTKTKQNGKMFKKRNDKNSSLPTGERKQTTSGNKSESGLNETGELSLRGLCKCGLCSDSFPDVESLCSHLCSHTQEMPYVCGVCGTSFFEGAQLLEHVSECHSVIDPYHCGLCSASFSLKADFIDHFKTCTNATSNNRKKTETMGREDVVEKLIDSTATDNHDDEVYEGPMDKADKLTGGNNVDKDKETIIVGISGDVSFKKKRTKIVMDDIDLDSVCTVIEEPSTAGGTRKKHLYQCKFCEKVCKDRGLMISHARCHMLSRPYKCTVCSMTFKQYSHLKGHLIRHTTEKPYMCDRCAKGFTRQQHLSEHIRLKHSEDKLFHCPHCSQTFQTRKEFCKHKNTQHKNKVNHQCPFCSKQFSNNTDYQRHCLSHTKEKRFECEVCHKMFALLANAKKHMKVHRKGKAHECSVCDKGFHNLHDLKRHKAVHEKRKNL